MNVRNSINKILLLILILVLFLCAFCGCLKKSKEEKIYETDYFRYVAYVDYVEIKGLTELGKLQEYIVIPEEIDGKCVKYWSGHDSVSRLKALYISYGINFINPDSWINPDGHMMFDIEGNYNIFYLRSEYQKGANFRTGGYIPTRAVESYARRKPILDWEQKYIVANMQYLYNYLIPIKEGEYYSSPNEGVHFIDNIEVGEKVNVIPTIPKRDGYMFTGWFKEEECINEINLESYVKEDDEILYLYAGWKKI